MLKYISDYINSLEDIIRHMDKDDIEKILKRLEQTRVSEGRIFVLGNGGSAMHANHFSCDLGKNVSKDENKRFLIVSICDNMGSITAYANDEGYENVFSEQLKNHKPNDKDVIFAISSSGNSPNVIKAVEYGKSKKCTTIGLTGFSGGKLKQMSDISLHIDNSEYEKVEDAHMAVLHIIVSYFKKCENTTK